MVDIDGKFEYSVVRTVLLTEKQSSFIVRNPVQNILELVATGSEKSQWQILNVNGQLIKQGIINAGRTEISVTDLPAGNYWVRFQTDKKIQTLPFIKQ